MNMKKLLELLVAIKSQAAMLFGGAIMLYIVAGWWFGLEALPFSLVWQMAILSVICSAWQFVCLGGIAFQRLGRPIRIQLFFMPVYAILAASAYLFGWFSMTVHAWLIFAGVVLAISAILSGVYAVYYRITGVRLNQMLAAYKDRQTNEARS
jgi:hypothetical protein